MIHEATMFNYTVVRYVPVWEVKSSDDSRSGLLSQHTQFFKQADSKGLQALKDMLYTRGLVPEEVARLDGSDLEARLSEDRFTIYYRVEFGNHSIFLCHLNNSPVRSVVPFRIEQGRWILDPDFADTEFYELLSSPDYDPYMGLKGGRVICSYGFEEVSGLSSVIQDYSGMGNHAPRTSVSIVDGRFGGAMKLNGSPATSVTPDWGTESVRNFTIDFHLQVARMLYNTEKHRTILSLGQGQREFKLETANGLLRLTYPTSSGFQRLEWPYSPDVWSLLSIEFHKNQVSVKENGVEVASSRLSPLLVLKDSPLRLGAPQGVKANLDELRISILQ